MTPKEIFDLIEQVAATSSKTAKEQLLKPAMADPFFVKVMEYTYNPFKTFGLRAIPTLCKARGEWSLDEPHAWVVLDLLASREMTGDAARDTVQLHMDNMDASSSALLWRILRKDMRAGFGANTLNKLMPGLIADPPYMRCSLIDDVDLDKWPWASGCISQIKADGMFANFNVDAKSAVWLTTRQGNQFPPDELEDLNVAGARTFKPGTQTHGELIVFDGEVMLPRQEGNGILNSVLQGGKLPEGHRVQFLAWDQIPLSEAKPKGKYKVPYKERLRDLLAQIAKPEKTEWAVKLIETRVCLNKAAAFDHYRDALRRGLEGTVGKRPDMIWKDGTSKEQIKFKLEVTVDLRVKGFVPGEGKNASTFGSIEGQSECGELLVNVSGFSDKQRKEIHDNRDAYIDKVMAVKANSLLRPSKSNDKHSLFLPRVVEFREDKIVADNLAEIERQFAAAVA